MELSGRLYHCGRCQRQVIICNRCDRNHIYCGPVCSRAARQESSSRASQRYQQSPQGRRKHAERQRRYRARQENKKNKVTHQSSPVLPAHVVLPRGVNERILGVVNDAYYCHFCAKRCSAFLRRGYLHNAGQKSPSSSSSWPLAP